MKKIVKKSGKAKDAMSTTNPDCKIYYTVTLDIMHVDNDGNLRSVLSIEKEFRAPKALAARQNAFAYAKQIGKDAKIDGKLCDGHLDSPLEGNLKGYKNINMLVLNVNFIDDEGNIQTIYEKEFNAPNADELEALDSECYLYKKLNYDRGGDPHIVEDEDENQYEIINLGNNEASDSFYIVDLEDSIDEIRKNGIRAEEDGYIVLLTQKQIADNYVLDQLLYEGKYPLIEVSAKGITQVIKPYLTGEFAAFHQRLIKQNRIEPQYIKSIEYCDTSELKYYTDYYSRLGILNADSAPVLAGLNEPKCTSEDLIPNAHQDITSNKKL